MNQFDPIKVMFVVTAFLLLTTVFTAVSKGDEFNVRNYEKNYIMKTTGNEGTDENNLRFQFSLVTDLLGPIDFAYTQRAIWRLWDNSGPITDIDFNPKLFAGWEDINYLVKDVSFGYEHESNGLAGNNSRSWERVFYQQTLRHNEHVSTKTKIWAPFFLHENREIKDYQGIMEISLNIKYKQLLVTNTTRIKNNTFEVEWDLGDFNIYGQIFNGYGKNIKEYDKQNNYYGIGLSL